MKFWSETHMDKDNKPKQPYTCTIPRGIEVLIKKASVDTEFRQILLQKRADAAETIDLELTEAEQTMLSNMPAEQLQKIIDNTKVKPEHRKVFLGMKATLMLAAVTGLVVISMTGVTTVTAGISPDRVRKMQMKSNINPSDPNDVNDLDSAGDDSDESEQSQ
jgi:hypothetical protein